mgnify:CR=1 FL=1
MYKDSNERTQDYLANFEENEVIKKLVGKTAPVIVDVGANIGQSVVYYKHIYAEAKIHCFEPLPLAFDERFSSRFHVWFKRVCIAINAHRLEFNIHIARKYVLYIKYR